MSGSGFSKGAPVHLSYPLTGRLLVRNSPADRVPSHGTDLAATSHSIDLVPVDEQGRSSRYTAASFLRPEPPQLFIGLDRKSTRLNSSHVAISYAVLCVK